MIESLKTPAHILWVCEYINSELIMIMRINCFDHDHDCDDDDEHEEGGILIILIIISGAMNLVWCL